MCPYRDEPSTFAHRVARQLALTRRRGAGVLPFDSPLFVAHLPDESFEELLELFVRQVLGAPLGHLVVLYALSKPHHRVQRDNGVDQKTNSRHSM